MRHDDEKMQCSFTNEESLYSAYMPFVVGGGLFLRTKQTYSLGDHVHLSVHLFEEVEPYEVECKIIWVTPKGAQGRKPAGIGLQFLGESSRAVCNKIETYLAGVLKSTQATDTM